MADVVRVEFNYWVCVVHQHDGGEREQGEARVLADVPAVSDAVLCVELFGVGEGQRVHSDFFAEADRNSSSRRSVRYAVFRCTVPKTA